MCAIAGIVAVNGHILPQGEVDVLAGMVQSMRHRGPDETGCRAFGPAALGHARLSIIDLSTGTQPIANEDGSVQVVFNGEIFNYPELRSELAARGHAFSTSTDTEVIVHAYEEKGPDCLHDFNGQFAFALWDARRRRLFLARDRVGICPLFYTEFGGKLLFASEVKALLRYPDLPRRLDPKALDQFFTFWSPLAPRTMFEGIHELQPGSYALLEDGALRTGTYWRLDFSPAGERSAAEASERLDELLTEATRIRLRADVPVGVYLSGGLDSSFVASRVFSLTTSPRSTFSVGFADADFDESAFQRTMAAKLNSPHSSILVDDSMLKADFLRIVWNAEKPSFRTAPAPLYRLSGLAREKGCKVVLTGEGADEFLAGYNIFKEAKVRQFWSRRPESALRPLLLLKLYPYLKLPRERGNLFLKGFFGRDLQAVENPFYSHALRWANTEGLKKFFSSGLRQEIGDYDSLGELAGCLPEAFGSWDVMAKAQYLEAAIFLPGYLLSTQGDRMLMANSVEGRFPFLDHTVIEYANSLPSRLKMPGLREKSLLKRAASETLPLEIVARAKQPYRAPAARSILNLPVNGRAGELLSTRALERSGYFSPAKVKGLLDKFEKTQGSLGEMDNMALLGILSTQVLHKMFIDGNGQAAV